MTRCLSLVCATLLVAVAGCRHLGFNVAAIRQELASDTVVAGACASSEAGAVATVCLKTLGPLKRAARSEAALAEVLIRNLVPCTADAQQQVAELVVGNEGVALRSGGRVMAQASRGGDFERALAQGMVLPEGSCESAFSKELLRRRAKPELKENFEQEDGTVPSVLYRGVALSGSLIAKILGSAPQHVMAAWTYTRLQEDLPPALQHSSLSALHVRERIYSSLMSTLQVPPGVPPEDVQKIEVFQLLELSEDAMKNTIVGSDRSQIVSRSLSVSSSFAQAYTYAKLNVSAEKIGFVLAFINIPGRGMPVVNKEWVIFSHIAKNTQLEAYLIFPKGEGVAKSKLGGTVFYDFAGYDLFRMRSAGTQWDGRLSVARCDAYVSQSGQALPTCHDEAFASQALEPSFPEGLRELIHEVKDEAAYRSSSEVEQRVARGAGRYD